MFVKLTLMYIESYLT